MDKKKFKTFYIQNWYKDALPKIKSQLKIKSKIPDFNTWEKCDTTQSEKNITNFTKEIKKCITENSTSENEENKKILKTIKNNFVKNLHKEINEDKIEFTKMVFADYKGFAEEALNKKDNYCLYKDINENKCYMYNKITFPNYLNYENLTLNEKSVNLSFKISDKNKLFREAMVCWKNGTGIRNVAFKCI